MGDTSYFDKVVSASNAPLTTLTGQWGAWRGNLGMIQLLGNHINKAENLILMSEGDLAIHPHTTVPVDMRPSEWLNPRLLPDLHAEQLALVQQYREEKVGDEVEEEGQLAQLCNAHGEMCRSLAESFKSQRESMNQSLPRNAPQSRTTPPQNATLASLMRSMQHGEGLVDNAMRDQVRQQQQQHLLQQYQAMAATRMMPATPAQGTAAASNSNTPASATATPAGHSMHHTQPSHTQQPQQTHQPMQQGQHPQQVHQVQNMPGQQAHAQQQLSQQQQQQQQHQHQQQLAAMRQQQQQQQQQQAVHTMGGPPGAKPTTAPVMNSAGQTIIMGRGQSAPNSGMMAKATGMQQGGVSAPPPGAMPRGPVSRPTAPSSSSVGTMPTSYAAPSASSSSSIVTSSEYAPTRNVQFGPGPTPGPNMRTTGGYAQSQVMQAPHQSGGMQQPSQTQQGPSGFGPHAGAPVYGSQPPHNLQPKPR